MNRFAASVTLRLIIVCLAAALGASAVQAQAPSHARVREFTRDDYEKYFTVGRFASFSPYYASDGILEIVGNRKTQVGGEYVLEQTTHSFDTSVNYDINSKFPNYKIESKQTDQMTWDAKRRAYVYDYSEREFDTDASRVWESNDLKVELSPGDKGGGLLHKFYRDVDTRAGRDAKASEKQFRKDVTGLWVWRCAYDSKQGFDVVCTATHDATKRVETFFYRKMDLVG